jgi:SpoVK/Ycf46/Vps4 family AAA+-type ATPase
LERAANLSTLVFTSTNSKNASGKKNSQGSDPAINRNGGGVQVTGPSSTSSRTSKNNSNRNNNNNNNKSADDDDEELPEELQHLDKELVKKIQNEIMESGDMVTFDDIAGLDDAKQTVQEVVCWPMKRPDLFTGLRRAPNGLLLYGPPGTVIDLGLGG